MIDFRLIHDGKFWIADRGSITAMGRTLEELDRNLTDILREKKEKGTTRIQVRMTFDNKIIPEWMRQYSNHYFNRLVEIDF